MGLKYEDLIVEENQQMQKVRGMNWCAMVRHYFDSLGLY